VPVDASWTFSPGVLAALALIGGLYARRWLRVRELEGADAAPVVRLLSFGGGLLCLLIALISPVDRLGEQVFAMHMLQHLLLLDLAPILLICGTTRMLLRPVTRRVQTIERAAGPLAHPVFAVFAYVATMYIWHIPAAYDAALEHPFLHAFEHITFAAAGTLYWWHLLSPIRGRHRLGGLGPVGYMVSTKIAVGLLGVVLTFAPDTFYSFYERQPDHWGLSPAADQNVGGAFMALEQSIVMGIALVWLFVRQLGESEREEERRERYSTPS